MDNNGNASVNVLRLCDSEVWPIGCTYQRVPWDQLKAKERVYSIGLFHSKKDIKKLADKCELYIYTNSDKQIKICDELITEGVKLNGTRSETDAPCLSIWRDFFPTQEPPLALKLISSYHTWTKELSDCNAFFYGLSMYYTRPDKRTVELWNNLLSNKNGIVDQLVKMGTEIVNYNDILYGEYCKDLAYPTQVDTFKTLAANVRQNSMILAAHRNAEYFPVFCNYEWDCSIEKYRVSLYANNINVDVGRLSEKFGGSKGVAGFLCTDLPFEEKKSKHESDIDGKDELPFADVYSASNHFKNKSFSVDKYSLKNCQTSVILRHCFTKFEGHSAVVCNTPSTDRRIFYPIELVDQTLAIAYVYTNFGEFRVVVHPLLSDIDLKELADKFGGKVVNGAVWFYSPILPFSLNAKFF